MSQIITNLLGNAIKFTPQGNIELRVKKTNKVGDRTQLRISVTDSGIGIHEEDLPRLFNYFTQLDDSKTKRFKGTGLGLAISRRLVELMGGEIFVESKFGEGSTFSFTIWIETADLEPEAEQPLLTSEPDQAIPFCNILLVEDDQVNQLVIQGLCKKFGWNLKVASNGHEALEMVQKFSFDAVLMDIQIPEVSGLEVTKIIREKEKITGGHVPIIASTAYAMEDDIKEALAAGMDEFISKPIDIRKLYRIIKKLSSSSFTSDKQGGIPMGLLNNSN